MSDDAAKIIIAESVIAAAETAPGRRRFLGRAKEREKTALTNCENCGAPLQGTWCARCGQPAVNYRQSIRHVIVDVLDSFLNWDSKIFATFWWLLIRPWRLTNEFLAGHRVRYLNPLRLYLFASIGFFFVINHWSKSIHVEGHHFTPEERADIDSDLKNDKDLTPQQRAEINSALAWVDASPGISPSASRSVVPTPTPSPQSDRDFGPLKLDRAPSTPTEKWIEERAREKLGEHGSRIQLFLAALFSNVPYMMLCCIPLFALVLKLLYIRRHILYIDHLIYALHIHSFAYIAIIIAIYATRGLTLLPSRTAAGLAVAAVWILFAMQIFLSIRRVYRQGWVMSILKFCVGGIIYLTVLILGISATFFITLALPS